MPYTDQEYELNKAATFLPLDPDAEDRMSLPALSVAGVLVFAYVKDGRLRVSVDLDDAGESGYWTTDCIPMQIDVQADTVFAAGSDGKAVGDLPFDPYRGGKHRFYEEN